MSCKAREGGDARSIDAFVRGCGGDGDVYGDGAIGCVPVVDGGASADEGVPFVEAIPIVEGGPLSQPRTVSREFIEEELERWSDLLERLGNH